MEELGDLERGFGELKTGLPPRLNAPKEIKGSVDVEMQSLKGLKNELVPEGQDNKEEENELKQPEEVMSPDSPMSPTKRRLLELQDQGRFLLSMHLTVFP